MTPTLSKREIARRAEELDTRRQAQMSRQVDSINRLLSDVRDEIDPLERGAREIQRINELLAEQDIKIKELESILRRALQMVTSKIDLPRAWDDVWIKRLQSVLKGLDDEGPYHLVQEPVESEEAIDPRTSNSTA